MYDEKRTTVNLMETDLRLWIDGVLLPAIYENLPASYVQHLPGSYDGAKYNSLAKSIESRRRDNEQRPSRMQLLKYFIKAEVLHSMWQRIHRHSSGLAQSRDLTTQHLNKFN